MPADPFFTDDFLEDIIGRCKFGAVPIEYKLEEIPEPSVNVDLGFKHPEDERAKILGLESGFHLSVLEQAAQTAIREGNPTVIHFYQKFLIAVHAVCYDAVDKIEERAKRVAIEKEKATSRYQEKHRSWENRRKKLVESWQGCRKTIHTRWERLGRGLAKLLEQDARIESLSNREQTLVADLRRLGVAKVSEGRVIHIDWDKFADVTVEDINTITQKMIKL